MYKNGAIMPVDENTYYIYDGVSDKFIKRAKTTGCDYNINKINFAESYATYWASLLAIDIQIAKSLQTVLTRFSQGLVESSTSSDILDGYDVGLKLQKCVTSYYINKVADDRNRNFLKILSMTDLDMLLIPRYYKASGLMVFEVHCGTREFDETIDEFIAFAQIKGYNINCTESYLSNTKQHAYVVSLGVLSKDITEEVLKFHCENFCEKIKQLL